MTYCLRCANLPLQAVLAALGGGRAAYRGVMLCYAGFCALWLPLSWVIPSKALKLGQVRSDAMPAARSDIIVHLRSCEAFTYGLAALVGYPTLCTKHALIPMRSAESVPVLCVCRCMY